MVRELLSSPCWFFATCALFVVVYGLGTAIVEIVKKRWSLSTISKRLTRIERKLKGESSVRASPPREKPDLRLVHSVREPKPKEKGPYGKVVRLDDYRPEDGPDPPQAS